MRRKDVAYELLRQEIANTNPEFQSRFLLLYESRLAKNNRRPRKSLASSQHERTPAGSIERHVLNIACCIWTVPYRIRFAFAKRKKLAYIHFIEGTKKYLINDLEAAIADLKAALALCPELEGAKQQLADLYFENSDYPRALKHLKQTKGYSKIIEILERRGKMPEERSAVKDHDLPDLPTCQMSGKIFYHLGQHTQSVEVLKYAIDAGLKDSESYYLLGLCYLALQNPKDARLWFRKAMEISHQNFIKEKFHDML
jgi:tetratricopeptide (TPR) repeat protein